MTDEAEPILTTAEENAADPDDLQLPDNPCVFTFWERVKIFLASRIGYFVVLLVGRSLRWEVQGWENWEAARKIGKGLIYTFWHREIFAATWFWRKRGIVVMTSRNFDGEYIARIIQRHGYGAARGSSSRGAGRALVEMIRCLGGAWTQPSPSTARAARASSPSAAPSCWPNLPARRSFAFTSPCAAPTSSARAGT